ncbi:Outer membrane protein OmpA [Chitinophaga sp. CF118]|uniref:OmpA family protein n=1 Tax=Chitinophaga sp. CF118 TaxID=1884367 RepID=UPI0008F21B25|nr:OmpA family protein [Chitinophaga sp. CF118]SFD90866.1 Outer membrane protein OmpA [Chitinophaga sp. CF118]
MKGILLILIVPLLICLSINTQAQQTGLQGINYQAIARNAKGEVLALQAIQVKFSILDGSEAGSASYVEIQNATTTAQGLFTLMIGKGQTQLGSFSNIPWSNGNQYLQVEIDINGSGTFLMIGVMPFMSVPYALYAANGGSGGGGGGSVAINWLGSYAVAPASAIENQAYYNSTDKKAYIYDSTGTWQILAQDGIPGTSIFWLGTFTTDPTAPGLNQAYYNTTDKKAYIYDGTAWQILSQDGVQGVSISWQGTFATAPASPSLNQAYYNTTDRTSYIYDGTAWQILAEGGSGFTIKTLDYKPTGHVQLTTSALDTVTSTGRTWLIGGNQATDGSADFIGTLDSTAFIIKTNGNGIIQERMRFNAGPGILINGTADTTVLQGTGVLAVYSGNAPLALNTTPNVPLNGINAYAGGNSAAIFGRNYSGGFGVKGVSNTGYGIYGYGSNKNSYPVRGENSSINGGYGIYGVTMSPALSSSISYGSGIIGYSLNTAAGVGVLGVGNKIDLLSPTALPLPTGAGGVLGGAGVVGIGTNVGTFNVGTTVASGVGVAGGGNNQKPVVPVGGAGVSGNSLNIGVAGYAQTTNTSDPEVKRWGGYFEYRVQTINPLVFTPLVYTYLAGRYDTASTRMYLGITSNAPKATIVKDDNGNRRLLYCTEAPEVLFQDFGEGQLKNGITHIDLERLLTRSIRVDEKHPLKVFIQLEGECNGVFVTNKSAKGFDVKELQGGKSDVSFTWQIVASRADEIDVDGVRIAYSDSRFGAAPGPLPAAQDSVQTSPVKATLKTEEEAVVNKAFKNLQFSTGKAEISKSSLSSLDNIATLLQAHPEWHLKLSGHTDSEGTPALNQELSEKRSEAVKQYLQTKGVDAKHISAIGYGQTKPLTTNQTKAEREKNRRVEMEIFTEQQ